LFFYHTGQVAARVAKLVLSVHLAHQFWGKRRSYRSVMVLFETATVVSYRFTILTIVLYLLYLTIRP